MEIKAQVCQMKRCVQTEISIGFIFHKAKELCQIPALICFLQGAWANSPHWTSPMFCLSLPLSSILSCHCRRCSVFHRIEPEKLHIFGSGWAPATLIITFFFFFLIEVVLVPAVQIEEKKTPPLLCLILCLISSGEKLLYSVNAWPGHLSEGQFLFWVGSVVFLHASPPAITAAAPGKWKQPTI